jgi:3-methyladenine DNA glycosylase AlkD
MHTEALASIRNELEAASEAERREFAPRFFKAGRGEYGEGDRFYGTPVPAQRKIARRWQRSLDLDDITTLMESPMHEERFVALVVMVYWYGRANSAEERAALAEHYVSHFAGVNNWDLVDTSAPKILGPHVEEAGTELLYDWARSGTLWQQRAAVLATAHFISKDSFDHTLRLAKELLRHEHDLMHKAVGWMLREVGKRNEQALHAFLGSHCLEMPRTMLRYAVEKLPEAARQRYMRGQV